MIDQPRVDCERGSLVTLASVEGLEGTAGSSIYNAAKGGVVMLTNNIALDYGPSGIRANAICPGFIETPLTESVFGLPGMEGPRASVTQEHALQRLGRPAEIAAMAATPRVATMAWCSSSDSRAERKALGAQFNRPACTWTGHRPRSRRPAGAR